MQPAIGKGSLSIVKAVEEYIWYVAQRERSLLSPPTHVHTVCSTDRKHPDKLEVNGNKLSWTVFGLVTVISFPMGIANSLQVPTPRSDKNWSQFKVILPA